MLVLSDIVVFFHALLLFFSVSYYLLFSSSTHLSLSYRSQPYELAQNEEMSYFFLDEEMSYFFVVQLDCAFSLVLFVLYSVICHLSVYSCHQLVQICCKCLVL